MLAPQVAAAQGFRMSPQQRRVWRLQQEDGWTPYRAQALVRFQGPRDAAALRSALEDLVAQNEILRTRLECFPGMKVPVQVIDPEGAVAFSERELAGDEALAALWEELAAAPADPETGPAVTAVLARLEGGDSALLLSLPAAFCDARSLELLVAGLSGAEEGVQYADVSEVFNDLLEGEDGEPGRRHWEARNLAPRLDKAGSAPFLPARTTVADLDARSIDALAERTGTSPRVVLLAAWTVLLRRLSEAPGPLVAALTEGRAYEGLDTALGLFARYLPLAVDADLDLPFAELAGRVRDGLAEAEEWQDSFDVEGSFRYGFDYREMPQSIERMSVCLDRFAAHLAALRRDGRISLELTWDAGRMDSGEASRLAARLRTLVASILADPNQPARSLAVMDEDERRQVLEELNRTEMALPEPLLAHERFLRQAVLTPERRAVVFGDRSRTYAEVADRSARIAARLRELGVGAEVPVALFLDRRLEVAEAVLGILRAGGIYVPLDPGYPSERLRFVLEDSGTAVVLTTEALAASLPPDTRTLLLDREDLPAAGDLSVEVSPEDAAYVIYTSGSTGRPKGCVVEHRSLGNHLEAVRTHYLSGGVETLPLLSGLPFDASLKQLLGPLTWGGEVVVVPDEAVSDPSALLRALSGLPRVALNCVPSLWRALLDLPEWDGVDLAALWVGGEATDARLLERTFERFPDLEVLNLYGPTEVTVNATLATLRPGEDVTIGRPVPNGRVYLLDDDLLPVPLGVTGEICVGGLGVARGYLGRPDLTAERFLTDPFSGDAGARLYRTGDLGRWNADGRLEFLGRRDHQVKLRGFRVELGEIEAVLRRHPAVSEAVVTVRDDERLVGYLVAERGQTVSEPELRALAQEHLPRFMVPAALVVLPELPRTPFGKVDRAALPAPESAQEDFVPPSTPVEELVAELFAQLLKLDRVGARSHFFDLGGHSLLATQVIARVREVFGVDVPLRSLFDGPTPADFAARIERELAAGNGLQAPPIAPDPRTGLLPLSFAQQRLFFLDRLMPGSPIYNVPGAVRLLGELNVPALARALGAIRERHEVLRTVYALGDDGEAVQIVLPAEPFELSVTDVAGEAELLSLAREEARRPFDLERGPVFRASLARLAAQDHALLLNVHHVAFDGWSVGILLRELTALYEAFSEGRTPALPELPVQYADYAAWQRGWLQGEALEEQTRYWREALGSSPEVLALPTDRPRPAVPSFQGDHRASVLPDGLYQALRDLGRQEGSTLFMAMLAGFQSLLHRYTGQRSIVVGTPIANRQHREVEGLIGFFANTLALRGDFGGEADDPSFRELLRRTREAALGAYAHQDMPFEHLVDELQVERSLSHNPLFQVSFSLRTPSTPPREMGGLALAPVKADAGTAKFDLTLLVTAGDELSCSLEHSTELFDGGTAERMLLHLERLLQAAVADPDASVAALPLLTDAEREQALAPVAAPAPDRCLHQLFEEQAARTPDAVAIQAADGSTVSYRDLDARADALAGRLRALGVGPDERVAVGFAPSVPAVVSLLAVLKAGGAYLPLDPTHPPQRLAFLVQDAGAKVALCDEALRDVLGLPTIDLDAPAGETSEGPSVHPDNLAYVIYTSGSTGTPKGTMLSHRAVVSYLAWAAEAYRVADGAGSPVHSSLAFDLTVTSLFTPLITGRTVFLVSQKPGVEALASALRKHEGLLVKLTPAHLDLLAQVLPPDAAGHARTLVVGGEALHGSSLAFWREHAPGTRIVNEYGPTEASVGCCIHEASGDDIGGVPIGRPTANARLHVLDSRLQLQPDGIAGELYIAGHGLARGYLGRPDLTAERFLPDPFADRPGQRLYRTGDLARRRPDGVLEFLGRSDDQVKLRGYRIELGEVEAALTAHPGVREAAVAVREAAPGDLRLVAWYVPRDGVSPDELRSALKERLPEPMVPTTFVQLASLPLAASGKVDRRALPAPAFGRGGAAGFVAPRSSMEMKLALLWEELLGTSPVGARDNFFDLGGHSFLALRLVGRIREELGRELPLAALFQAPVLEQLAALLLQDKESAPWSPLVPIQPQGSGVPFFCVHSIGGNALRFYHLARHLGDRPFYGLQAPEPVNLADDHPGIAEMAADYVRAIREVQLQGPYLLGGYSFGSTVAFEMANQLERQGERVALLALIDGGAPLPERRKVRRSEAAILAGFARDAARSAGRELPLEHERIRDMDGDEAIRTIFDTLREHDLLPPEIGPDWGRRFLRGIQARLRAAEEYDAPVYPGRTTLFRSTQEETESAKAWREAGVDVADPTRGWDRLTSEPLEIRYVSGYHVKLMDEPLVADLARELSREIEAALEAAEEEPLLQMAEG